MQAEADLVLGDRTPMPEDLTRLPYTRAIVQETLRPPAWTIGRQSIRDCEIGGQHIPAGSIVLVSQWVTHHDPRFYADPLEFRPERWDEIEGSPFPRYAFFPFGGGSRSCIGEHFAMTETIAVLSMITRRWQVLPINEDLAKPQPSVTLRSRSGIPLQVERRNIQ